MALEQRLYPHQKIEGGYSRFMIDCDGCIKIFVKSVENDRLKDEPYP